MMPVDRLLGSNSRVEQGEGANIVGIHDEAADEVFEALSAATAREILTTLYKQPDTASGVAEVADTSLQNATYHLEKLVDAGLVEVADTWYSEQGREMKVYAPMNESLVLFASDEVSSPSLKDRLLRILGAVGILGVGSIIVQRLITRGANRTSKSGDASTTSVMDSGSASGDAGSDLTAGVMNSSSLQPTAIATEDSTAYTVASEQAVQTGWPIQPGLLFFAGGLLVLALVLGYVWWRTR